MVDSVNAATVLVTETLKRTQKLLMAVGQGKPICSPEWIHMSKKAGEFLGKIIYYIICDCVDYMCILIYIFTTDPWDYILIDNDAENKWNFSLQESLARSQRKKLLENHNIVLAVNNATDVLKGILGIFNLITLATINFFAGAIEACGGKCFTKAPSKNITGEFIVVSAPNDKSKYSKYLKQNPQPMIVVPEAIFDGVLRQELHFADHLIT